MVLSTRLFLFLIGYTIQAIAEELICRGYLMGYWLKRNVLSSLFNKLNFVMFLHVVNAGFDVYAALSLFLFSVLMSEIRLISGNIWLCSAINAAWHFRRELSSGQSSPAFLPSAYYHLDTDIEYTMAEWRRLWY